ncbi:N-acetylmuramoyl-L-alanine amidase [Streptomyces noursei]|uniref:N-acetylmuramoyl-L-alanine amidase n=1 Tax=Streptomyces noursei TaxID=1971 RepID=UPI0023B82B1D|nr:N-acetylmuramoyl-L-alanine amidase [Streptomyces noursei]
MSGPHTYPGANLGHWYQSSFSGNAMETNVIVWHSTEGTSLPTYSGGAVAPNLTAVPNWSKKRIDWYQHFGFDTSSRALVNLAGGVETNTLNVCQVEVVGTCDPATHKRWGSTAHLYMPELPDWAVRDLSAFARWAHDQHGVPLTSSVAFKAYPGSYGSNGVRMSASAWTGYRGHCGHQHVPENDHGDPGAFPMAAILTAAGKTGAPSGGGGTSRPTVSVARLIVAARTDPPAAQGHTTYRAEVLLVEQALAAEGLLNSSYADGSYGTKTVTAYAALQRRYGYTGRDADGIPGITSLTRLGAAHGFTVTP